MGGGDGGDGGDAGADGGDGGGDVCLGQECSDDLWHANDDLWIYYMHTDPETGEEKKMRKRKPRKIGNQCTCAQQLCCFLVAMIFLTVFMWVLSKM